MAIYYLGTIYLDKGDMKKAAEYFQKTIVQRPQFDAPYFNLGLISEVQRTSRKEAEEYYNKAISINPHNLQARERLAQIYFKQKETDKAIEQYKRISSAGPCKHRYASQSRNPLF